MSHRDHSSSSFTDAIARLLFPNLRRSARRKHFRFLMLALFLALVVCGVFSTLLWLAHRT